MKDRKPPIRDAAEQAVSEAWQALPQAEPPPALDARVREGVAAILKAEREGAAPTAKIVPFPAWRRATVPLAIAATLVLAFGVGRLWMQDEARFETAPAAPQADEAPPIAAAAPAPAPLAQAEVAGSVNTDSMKAAKPAPVPKPARIRERAEAKREAAAPQERVRRSAAEAPAEAVAVAKPEPVPAPEPALAPPPPPPVAAALARREAESLQANGTQKAELAQRSQSETATSDAPSPIAAAPAAPPPTVQAKPSAEPAPVPTLDMIREALRDGRRIEAKLALKRWREAHPQTEVPEDLRALAAELDAEPPAR